MAVGYTATVDGILNMKSGGSSLVFKVTLQVGLYRIEP
jgi:hypothetical protein